MEVINNGKGLTIKASYIEAAIITEAIRKGVQLYRKEGAEECARRAEELIDEMVNRQIIK